MINEDKTEAIMIERQRSNWYLTVTIQREITEQVEQFVFLGGLVTADDGNEKDTQDKGELVALHKHWEKWKGFYSFSSSFSIYTSIFLIAPIPILRSSSCSSIRLFLSSSEFSATFTGLQIDVR